MPKMPPVVGPLLRPFHIEKRVVPPAKLSNSPRLESLVRSGNLYLSVQDVIALVLEIIWISRCSATALFWRARFCGAPREADICAGGHAHHRRADQRQHGGDQHQRERTAGGAGLGSGGGIVSQIGPIPPNLDPSLYFNAQFGHLTTPETNILLNETSALVNSYQQLFFSIRTVRYRNQRPVHLLQLPKRTQ